MIFYPTRHKFFSLKIIRWKFIYILYFVFILLREIKCEYRKKLRVQEKESYSRATWCVYGQDEPKLHLWPFNQFTPILRKTIDKFGYDDNRFHYDIQFKSIRGTFLDVGYQGKLHKTVHVEFTSKIRNDSIPQIWEPFPIEGIIIQANHNPGTIGLPTGQFFYNFRHNFQCNDCNTDYYAQVMPCRKTSKLEAVFPTILIFHHLMKPYNYKLKRGQLQNVGKKWKIHSNFRWYNIPCVETNRLQFLVLAVRSFKNHEYDIFTLGPYETSRAGYGYQSDINPSPIYYADEKNMKCHGDISNEIHVTADRLLPVEMSSKFACCVRKEANPLFSNAYIDTEPNLNTLNQSSSNRKFYSCEKDPSSITEGHESTRCFFPPQVRPCQPYDSAQFAKKVYQECQPCQISKENESIVAPKKLTLTAHGTLTILSSFLFFPFSVFVARFYKETFSKKIWKGVRAWHWVHISSSLFATFLAYFGQFYTFSLESYTFHKFIGKIYAIVLAICLFTSFLRHENNATNFILVMSHATSGYAVIISAVICIATVPISSMSKIMLYSNAAALLVFTIILTFHVLWWDFKFGMKPRRHHIVALEARFTDVPIPGQKFRDGLLIVFTLILFATCITSLVFMSL